MAKTLPGNKMTRLMKDIDAGKKGALRKTLAVISLSKFSDKEKSALRAEAMRKSQKDKPSGKKEVEKALLKKLPGKKKKDK